VATQLARVLNALDDLADIEAGAGADNGGETTEPGNLQVVLNELLQQLEDYDTSAQDTLDRYHRQLSSGPLGSHLQSLESAPGDYDMDTAADITRKMLGVIEQNQT
jgi:hypothetical protein